MADPVRVGFKLIDSGNKSGILPVHFPSTMTLAEAGTSAVALATLIDAASKLKVDSANILLPLDLTGATIKGSAVADCRVAEGWNLVFDAADTAFSHSIRLPDPIDSLVEGYILNTTAGAVADLIAAIIAGISTDPDPTDDVGNDLVAFLRSKYSQRKVKL